MKENRLTDKMIWAKYEAKNYLEKNFSDKDPKRKEKNCCGQRVLDKYEVNRIIGENIKNNNPFWAGRMGFIEMNFLRQMIKYRMIPILDHRENALQQLCQNAGFFPFDIELGEKYADLILEDSKYIDLQGYWHLSMEDYIHDLYQKSTMVTFLSWLEPWRIRNDQEVTPWSSQLKGKKVLVIHPFEQSIRMQYENNREKIFSSISDDFLPEFELKTIKAVQTIGETKDDRFKDWFEALDWMKSECYKTDFDVAIVGCGAYGFHLAAEIKRMRKSVIHLGGATQILFGIIGKRWEEGDYKKLLDNIVNNSWVRPLESEKPNDSNKIEEGCYW